MLRAKHVPLPTLNPPPSPRYGPLSYAQNSPRGPMRIRDERLKLLLEVCRRKEQLPWDGRSVVLNCEELAIILDEIRQTRANLLADWGDPDAFPAESWGRA